ncbi:MAG TPA: TonB family protein [Terriglobales bacterium]
MADLTSPISLRGGYVYPPDLPHPPSQEASIPSAALSVALAALVDKINSGELSADDLLHRIAEQSCLMAQASSAAVALRREDGAVVCRASCGVSAPPLGARLNAYSGISGECLRSGRVLSCEDAEIDLRVDPLVCRQLGIRSIVAIPLRDDHATVGILEVFSEFPGAFSGEHIQGLQNLAYFARAATATPVAFADVLEPYCPPPLLPPVTSPVRRIAPGDDSLLFQQVEPEGWFSSLSARLHWTVAASMVSIVLLALSALSLFLWMWKHTDTVESATTKTVVQANQASTPSPLPVEPTELLTVSASARLKPQAGVRASSRFKPPKENAASLIKVFSPSEAAALPASSSQPAETPPTTAPAVMENDQPPPAILASNTQQANLIHGVLSAPASLPDVAKTVSEGVVPGRLEHRVAPIYPKQARQLRIEGPVQLRAVIGEDGRVRDISVIKGDPALAEAAKVAVSQWRYKPYELNHKPVAISTEITIDFKLQ